MGDISKVNADIETVYQYCIDAGLTHEEIVKKASPLLRPIEKKELRKNIFVLLKLTIWGVVFGLVCTSDPVSKRLSAHSRIFMFKLLQLWDWTDLYSENCLVSNPYYLDQHILETDCQVCDDVFNIEHLNRTDPEENFQLHLKRDLPFIATDATLGWPAMEDSFTILNLTEGYISIDEDVCKLETNLRASAHHEVFNKILSEYSLKKWFSHWENCGKASSKFLRRFYSRPYFISDLVQMTESNWLFMSSSYKGKKFRTVPVSSRITMVWVAQVRGFQYISLSPKEPCQELCHPLQDTIEEGDMVVYNPTLWEFSYLPGEEAENLAIAAEGSHYLK